MSKYLIESLKEYKEKNKLSDRELSRRLGVHWNTIYNWLYDKYQPSRLAEQRIREFLIKNL